MLGRSDFELNVVWSGVGGGVVVGCCGWVKGCWGWVKGVVCGLFSGS